MTTVNTTGTTVSLLFLIKEEIKAPIGTAIAMSIIRSIGLLNFFHIPLKRFHIHFAAVLFSLLY